MMKPRFFFWHSPLWVTASLLVVALTGCAPQATPPPAAPSALPTAIPQLPPSEITPSAIPDVQSKPTSRGDNLEATDPATVALASGGLQLVEFFRFT